MIRFPNAKINLGLQITHKRADGFHNLCSIFYPVGWSDVLEIIPATNFEFSQSGIVVQGDAADNLCVKVYNWMKTEYHLPNVKIHLHKNIPIGAGLGGGSADAAFTMKMLNELFSLCLSSLQMQDAMKLFGSDCAFFIENKPTLAVNKGDEFESISLSLKGKYLVMVYPDLFISTKEAYSGIVPASSDAELQEIASKPIETWKLTMQNDFEKSLFPSYSLLAEIKNTLYAHGATYASMSGSGSTIFGIFEKEINLSKLFPSYYKIWNGFLE